MIHLLSYTITIAVYSHVRLLKRAFLVYGTSEGASNPITVASYKLFEKLHHAQAKTSHYLSP